MAYHDNLRSIPLMDIMSESEEDGEIEKEALSNKDTNNDEVDSESSKEDDSLDIKPPQATLKSGDRRRDDRKRSRHSRKHESSSKRRDHRRNHDRGSSTNSRDNRPTTHSTDSNNRSATHTSDSNNRSSRDSSKTDNKDSSETRTVRSHVDSSRFKSNPPSRDYRKNPSDSSSNSRDGRVNRSRRDPRDARDRPVEAKKDEKPRLDMLEECRRKRLLFMERKREQEPAKTTSNTDNKQSGGRDLREKLREKEKERKQRSEVKEKPERYRTPKEEKVVEEKDKTPEPEDESMDFEDDKEFIVEEEDGDSDQNSDEKGDTASSGTDSSGSGTEGTSNEDEENAGEEDTSESAEDEEAPAPAVANQPQAPEPPQNPPPPPREVEMVEELPPLPLYLPAIMGCRSVEEFDCLNKIEEGTYGVVYRARDKRSDEIVALKRLKMEKEREGFPITSLREINTLLKAQHVNIVKVREIVVGSNMDKIYIVMDYVEHDLKSLMETMKQPFLVGEVKTLMMQLLQAVAHLHDNWILHRDLKTSNLLLSHKGILKVGDFGLAREYGSPLKQYTPVVVTLWYRAPELLLGAKQYSCPIDMWSVGCIFGELLTMKPLFPGKSEIDQLTKVFKDLGTPSEKIWAGYKELPMVKKVSFPEYPFNNLRSRFSKNFTDMGFDLVNRFLTYNPDKRITAESALSHDFFKEKPRPVSPDMFPTWPAKSEQGHRKAQSSPKPPSGGKQYARQMGEADDGLISADGFHMGGTQEGHSAKGGFSLKF